MKSIINFAPQPLVSSNFLHRNYSDPKDATLTKASVTEIPKSVFKFSCYAEIPCTEPTRGDECILQGVSVSECMLAPIKGFLRRLRFVRGASRRGGDENSL
jgi:hypothetical protein